MPDDQNLKPDFEFQMVETKSVMSEAESAKAMTEIQSQITIAKRFPRDINQVYTKLMTACSRRGLADKAIWAYPRGGKAVTGPGIRLAEVAAQCYGNLDYGIKELEQKKGESVMQSYCYDLETNVKSSKTFTVKHEVFAKGKIKKLFDPRDVYEHTANLSTRRLRACILGIIPGDLINSAEKKCKLTVVGKSSEPIEDSVKKLISAFDRYSVSQEMIENHLGHSADKIDTEELYDLLTIFNSIKDGNAKRKDFFKVKAEEIQADKDEAAKGITDIADADPEPITFKEQPERRFPEGSKIEPVIFNDKPGLKITPPPKNVDKAEEKSDKSPPSGNPI